jgi:hypothetical protein
MRVHAGRTGVAIALLAEIGAVVGAFGGWLYLVGSTVLWDGLPTGNGLLGAALWAGLFAAPVGAVTLPLLGLTILRRTPIGRSVAYYTLGLLIGVAVAALLSPHAPTPPAVAPLVPGLALAGALAGALVARRHARDRNVVHTAS